MVLAALVPVVARAVLAVRLVLQAMPKTVVRVTVVMPVLVPAWAPVVTAPAAVAAQLTGGPYLCAVTAARVAT